MSANSDLLTVAITGMKQVRAYYDGLYREMCPHAMGWKNGVHHILSFQFGGQSQRGLPPGGQWKCMEVEGLTQIAISDGAWHTGTSHTKPQTCIDAIEIQIR